jgi:hypothetical protein
MVGLAYQRPLPEPRELGRSLDSRVTTSLKLIWLATSR